MDKVYIPTSSDEMRAGVPGSMVLVYRDLKQMDQLPRLPIILLYETKPGIGHWVTILRTPEGIEHFDSYGLKPDGELSFVPFAFKAQSGQEVPHLVKLLLDTGEPINFSDFRLQDEARGIATCGRWCVLRNMFAHLTSEAFGRMVLNSSKKLSLSPDEMVSVIV